ncbi:ATP-dependent endonuclease [Kocuria arenosa]|uniref:ATP-dependent nuclease n=1 Tax=Kocuria arenosa TaxID=3071446 RepID=UPI0034D505A4
MRLRKLSIRNFKGIQRGEWSFDSNFVALVGPGDSTKTSILDALGLVLTSRYNVTFTDADFYNCNPDSPISIEAVVVDLPKSLIEDRAHGKNRSGIRSDGSLEHDPLEEDDVEECLIIRLTVDETLEPLWEIVRPGDEDGERITAAQRAQLGFFRIGDYVDQHLRWGRASALTELTSSRTHVTHAVVEAQRKARQALNLLTESPLHDAAKLAQTEVKKLGSGPFQNLRPGLDPAFGAGSSALLLHEGDIPLTQYGLGSRRLLGLSIQENALSGQSIVAIDEVESGLDPHRLAHLVRYLKDRAAKGEMQVFFTTHSALVVESLKHDQLFVVRSRSGHTTVTRVPPELDAPSTEVVQGLIRARPSALLAQRVVVAEGATEVGLVKQLLWDWDSQCTELTDITSVTAGVAVTDGGGSDPAPKRAKALATLGYPTFLLIDGDVEANRQLITDASQAGVVVAQWPRGCALEDVVVDALDPDGLQEFIDIAVSERSSESVLASVSHHLGKQLKTLEVSEWFASHNKAEIKHAIALAAKGSKSNGKKEESKAWFKREDRGAELGALLIRRFVLLTGEDLLTGLDTLRAFAYSSTSSNAEA